MAMDGLVARVRDRIRAKHYSFQTEKAYLQWSRVMWSTTTFGIPKN
jgi:hypothetical protein